MSSPPSWQQEAPSSDDELEVRTLDRQMLDGWNKRSAEAFTTPFAEDGEAIGFDGSEMTGRMDDRTWSST